MPGLDSKMINAPDPQSPTADALIGSLLSLLPKLRTVEDVTPKAVATLRQAFLHHDDRPNRTLIETAGRLGPAIDPLIDGAFPEIARALGTDWASDRLSFVDVTIAATRIQEAVRALSPQGRGPLDVPSLLMVVPTWEQHSLPAVLAAHSLRKLGVPTRVFSGLSTAELALLTARARPRGILISVGSYRSVARAPEMIAKLRQGLTHPVPIIIGGPGLVDQPMDCAQTGADLATNDLIEALSFCDFGLSDAIGQAPAAATERLLP